MNFSQKILELRKEKRLSQEQLAELLNVSRQTVSKWELGQSVPEFEKLILISNYFNISLDDLLKDTINENHISEKKEIVQPCQSGELLYKKIGIIICSVGILCLIALVLVSAFIPSASDEMNASSFITINGTGICLIFCVLAIITGIFLLLKRHPK